MTSTMTLACPLCGLRFAARPLLELHGREDHRPSRRPDPAPRPAAARSEVTAARGRRPGRMRTALRRPVRVVRYANDEFLRAWEAIIRSARASRPQPRIQPPTNGQIHPGDRRPRGLRTPMSSAIASAPPLPPAAPPAGWLPQAGKVLVVLARPGQESADLGGVLYAFRRAGAGLALLCLSRGEASPLNSTGYARLEAIRPWELQLAASVLGISQVTVASFADGRLSRQPGTELAERIGRAIRQHATDLLLVIDPAAVDQEDMAVAAAACAAATRAGVPVLAHTTWGVPDAWMIDLGPDAATARAIQKAAAAAHESQSAALPQLIRRLDLLDGQEHLRWLARPNATGRLPTASD